MVTGNHPADSRLLSRAAVASVVTLLGVAALAVAACAPAHDPSVDRVRRLLLTSATRATYSPCGAKDPARTRLDHSNPLHAGYLSEVKKEIDAHWIYPMAAKQLGRSGQVVVAFAIHPDRSVRGIKVVHSASIEILDRYAVNAIRLAAVLLPVPSELGMDCIDLTATFNYELDDLASGAKPPLAFRFPGANLDLAAPSSTIPGRCLNITSPSRISFVDGVIAPAEFPYAEYLRLVRAQILERWGPPAPIDGRLRVIVLFELGRDGQVRGEPRVEVSSGHGAFDGAAVDAVRAAGPFCRFPSEARPAFLRLHVGFESQ